MTVGDRRYATRVLTARDNAIKNGHRWWPCSKRSLSDQPTECDMSKAKKPPTDE